MKTHATNRTARAWRTRAAEVQDDIYSLVGTYRFVGENYGWADPQLDDIETAIEHARIVRDMFLFCASEAALREMRERLYAVGGLPPLPAA